MTEPTQPSEQKVNKSTNKLPLDGERSTDSEQTLSEILDHLFCDGFAACHNAPTRLVGGRGDFSDKDIGITMHYECTECGQPCDIDVKAPGIPAESESTQIPVGQSTESERLARIEELDKAIASFDGMTAQPGDRFARGIAQLIDRRTELQQQAKEEEK